MRRGALALSLAVAVVGCTAAEPAPVDPAELTQLASELLAQGELELASELLKRNGLDASEAGRPVMARIALARGEFEEVFRGLGNAGDLTREERAIRLDACATGAGEAFAAGDDDLASRRIGPCETSDRVDLLVYRAMRTVRAGDPWDDVAARELTATLHESEEGPARDTAAAELEALLLGLSESTDDAFAAVNWRRRAFEVARNGEIGADLAQRTFDTARAIMTTRPQDAATLLERLYLRQIQGIDIPSTMVAEARSAAEVALFPVFLEHYHARFTRKWLEEDFEAGIYDLQTQTFTHPPLTDAAARRELQAWIYRRIERPAPSPLPSFAEQLGHCDDTQDHCQFTIEDLATFAYRATSLEQEYAAQQGVSPQY